MTKSRAVKRKRISQAGSRIKEKWAIILMFILVILLITACAKDNGNNSDSDAGESSENENFNETGMPIVDEPITLKFMAGKASGHADDYNEILLWKTYEEMSNIQIDWQLVGTDSREEKRNLALSSGNTPDVFYTMHMPNSDLLKYGEQGTFIKLNDLIEEYMPNLSGLLEEYPDIRKGATFPDGNIYSIPTIYDPEFTSVIMGHKLWIRDDWLDQLDMDVPETIDDFYDYLVAVKETDLNGNGENDEIPYGAYHLNGLIDILKGSFGVGNRGIKHSYIDQDPETDEVRFYPITDGYKEMIQYVAKLYEEKLVPENIFTLESNESFATGSKGLHGSTVYTSAETIYGEEGKKFSGVPVLEGPGGKQMNRATSPLAHAGGFVVTDKNEHVPETLRWLDYFYGEEGATLFFMGIEGETYEVDENGELEYVEEITNSPDGLTMSQEIAKYFTWGGGGYPGIVREATFKGAESLPSSIEATEKMEPYMTDEVWPAFTYTVEENKKLASLEADIHKYVSEMKDKFIAGSESFDKWDDYVKELEKMGLEEYMEIQQDAYERYKDN